MTSAEQHMHASRPRARCRRPKRPHASHRCAWTRLTEDSSEDLSEDSPHSPWWTSFLSSHAPAAPTPSFSTSARLSTDTWTIQTHAHKQALSKHNACGQSSKLHWVYARIIDCVCRSCTELATTTQQSITDVITTQDSKGMRESTTPTCNDVVFAFGSICP